MVMRSNAFQPAALDRLFPYVGGPEDLALVPTLLDERGGEFCVTLRHDPRMVAAVCRHGYMPMSEDATGLDLLLIKSHRARCVVDPACVHVSKSTRRRARRFEIRIDSAFTVCLDRIVAHHSERWLSRRLCVALEALHRVPMDGVAARSVEVYEGGDLVAGEIGYSCGRAYTSLSGFYAVSGAGSVQLACLGRMLERAGFVLWDLGMEIDYKIRLGGRLVERRRFLSEYRAACNASTPFLQSSGRCDELLYRQSSTG